MSTQTDGKKKEKKEIKRVVQCPKCNDAKWIKGYHPWGVPKSTPCPKCNEATDMGFRAFLDFDETNVPGYHLDYSPGAYMSSSQTGTEVSSDQRGLMPSTDMGIVGGRPVTGKIITVKIKENPIQIGSVDARGQTHWIALTKHEYDRVSPAPIVGRMLTVVYQGNTKHIDKITVHG